MPAYNAERYILQSVESVLAQTFADFELLIINDGSTDRTLAILADIADRRIRILDNPVNLGIVGSLNRGMAEARGRYIARLDADDCSVPTRFIKQKTFLDQHPDVVIVGTEMSVLERGEIRFTRQRADPDPVVLRWMLHIGNPVGHPSMMFRAGLIQALGQYLKPEAQYAEDFDFLHRALLVGKVAVIPEKLVIYRQHEGNLTRTRRAEMIGRTAAVLNAMYSSLLGRDCGAEALLAAEHLFAGNPLRSGAAAEHLGGFLTELAAAFVRTYGLDPDQRAAVLGHTRRLWWRIIQSTLRAGGVGVAAGHYRAYADVGSVQPPTRQIARSLAAGLVSRRLRGRLRWPGRAATPDRRVMINHVAFDELPDCEEDPPRLYIQIDTEAEFDWNRSFDRSLTSVSSMRQQNLAQAIFDDYGARPIYVVDYAVASQPDGYGPLKEIFDRQACAIGAHLHPWVNPPFEEEVSEFNSFAGNLPADLEERKLRALVAMIETNFHIAPMFFKAGRYGVGAGTFAILEKLGFQVDFSILPMADLRPRGGPDFRAAKAQPYRVANGRIVSVPMTRGQFGLLAPLPQALHDLLRSRRATRMHLPGILSRTHLANTVTLTPEGVSAEEQIQLIRKLVAEGCRTFVLHYHSPSLAMHTPYVRNDADLQGFLKNLATVCGFFFDRLGGMPGNPADLVPSAMRDRIAAPVAANRVLLAADPAGGAGSR